MPYNTGNAMPSKDPRDLYDNATNFDNFSNGPEATYPDRFGVPRRSLAGFGMAFDESQLARDASFQAFLLAAGYVWIGDYAAGITFTARNQYTVRAGSTYRVAPGTSIPYTLTGTWATDQPMLVLLETAGTILSQLGANAGAALVGTAAGITVQAALDSKLDANKNLASSVNLNTLVDASFVGIYRQSAGPSAQLSTNYPVAGAAGTLEVYVGANNRAMQEYTTSLDSRKFLRWCTSAAAPATWTAWREFSIPLGGVVGQSLINTGPGAGAWGEPTVVDTNTAPDVRSALRVGWVASNHTTPITVDADFLSVTNSLNKSILLPAFSQSIQQGVATTGPNTLDAGVWGGGEYHLFAIYDVANDVRALLFSRSRTAPTMPAGYTHKVYVGSNMRGATGNMMFAQGIQLHRTFWFNGRTDAFQLTMGVVGTLTTSSVAYATVSVVGIVPSTAVALYVQLQSMQGAVGGSIIANNGGLAGTFPASLSPPPLSTASRVANSDIITICGWLPLTDSGRNLYIAATGANSNSMVRGWELNL